ncbi:MAG: sigma-54 dependent transcriptional regulator [Methylobacter sp.]|nr:sigma-54 dependent transcriptional regulator [Methylobacter sp.]
MAKFRNDNDKIIVETPADPLITFSEPDSLALSIRATALVFVDPVSKTLLEYTQRIAPSEATILIIGETGTGKELIARHVHSLSHRREGPFIAVNCGAFSESLVESELFGHERGAFTGAVNARQGWFEAANGGTLFLDEIGDLPLAMQGKLLRVLQEREVVRIGSRQPVPIDVRLLAATNIDLAAAVRAGHFREDLYYRLNVAQLNLQPLRARPGDILPLVRYFLRRYSKKLLLSETGLTSGAEQKLLDYSWPGNIRELENSIHHALLISQTDRIQASDLQLDYHPDLHPSQPMANSEKGLIALQNALSALYEDPTDDLFEKIEETIIQTAYAYCERNQVQTARLLGISRNILRHRLQRFGFLAALSGMGHE